MRQLLLCEVLQVLDLLLEQNDDAVFRLKDRADFHAQLTGDVGWLPPLLGGSHIRPPGAGLNWRAHPLPGLLQQFQVELGGQT